MPVTIRPQPDIEGVNREPVVTSSEQLLHATSKAWTIRSPDSFTKTNKRTGPEDRPVLASSFWTLDTPASSSHPVGYSLNGVIPHGNGFVDGIIRAFQQDLHVVLRPDDVWLAIVTQFSFYVNGHAEELRGSFVAHEDKKELVLDARPWPVEYADFGALAVSMTGLMQEFLIEDDLRDWLVPQFSTTTAHDASVAAIVMMSTMKAYFEYVMMMGCGFPSVTLQGERSDWEDLRRRIDRFARYGDEPAEWANYVGKAVDFMVRSFDQPDSQEIKDFWMRVCHESGAEGSVAGVAALSGWITAFCFWDHEGKRIRQWTDQELVQRTPSWAGETQTVDRRRLVLDGIAFPIIRTAQIPKSVAEVPITVIDEGSRTKFLTTAIAGSVGMTATTPANKTATTVQPLSGWWILLDKTETLP